ncbi:MAG: GAF domain-containing protein [Anaerolineales bacterium]|nr:GAF domain-containing protein [Anaerolineales bacterium]
MLFDSATYHLYASIFTSIQANGIWLALAAIPMMAWLVDKLRGETGSRRPSDRLKGMPAEAKVRILDEEIERLRTVLKTTATLNSTLNYERVLEMMLDLAESSLPGGGAGGPMTSALLLFSNSHLYVASARGLTHADLRTQLPGEAGIIASAMETGETILTAAPAEDPELQRFIAFHKCKSVVCIPLVVGFEVYGMLIFGHTQSGYFEESALEILEVISQQAMVALQNARLYRDLEQEKERIAEIQEETRNKLARDLHDGPTQSVGAIAMRVNFARLLMQRDAKAAADELYKIENLARRTTKEIRQMLFTLRPLVLESKGLVPALEQLADKMRENHHQNVSVDATPGVVDGLEMGKQGVVFYIVEEAVNNARKHAKAEKIVVRLRRRGDMLRLEIEDDGIGFDVSAVQNNYEDRESMGMVNLRERSELVNGILRIHSNKGEGTLISVTVPMTVEAAERMQRPGFVS